MIFYPQMLDSGRFQEVSGGFRRFQVSGFRFQVSEGFRFQDSGFKGKHIDYDMEICRPYSNWLIPSGELSLFFRVIAQK